VSNQEPVSPSTKPVQFCNTAIQVMIVLSHHTKQDQLQALCSAYI
jgi:hypothetical protein